MAYLIKPVTWDIMPDGGIRYYSNGRDITAEYMEQQKHIKGILGTSYCTLMDTLKQQIKGFDLDCSHWGEEQNIQLEIQGNEVLALFNLWEYAAEEYPNYRIGDTIGKWTCREVIEQPGGYGKKYLVLFTHPFELKK